MSLNIQVPSDEIMRDMAKLAMEQATSYFAAQAREFAKSILPTTNGQDALEAFARAIENTNAKVWPKNGPRM